MATLHWGLAQILHDRKLSIRELSRRSHVTRDCVARMVSNRTQRIELPIIATLMSELRVPISALLVATADAAKPVAPAPPPRPTPAVTPPTPTPTPTPKLAPAPLAAPAPQPHPQSPRMVAYAVSGETWRAETPAEFAEVAEIVQRHVAASSPPPPRTDPIVADDEEPFDENDEEMVDLKAVCEKLEQFGKDVQLNNAELALYIKYDLRDHV